MTKQEIDYKLFTDYWWRLDIAEKSKMPSLFYYELKKMKRKDIKAKVLKYFIQFTKRKELIPFYQRQLESC